MGFPLQYSFSWETLAHTTSETCFLFSWKFYACHHTIDQVQALTAHADRLSLIRLTVHKNVPSPWELGSLKVLAFCDISTSLSRSETKTEVMQTFEISGSQRCANTSQDLKSLKKLMISSAKDHHHNFVSLASQLFVSPQPGGEASITFLFLSGINHVGKTLINTRTSHSNPSRCKTRLAIIIFENLEKGGGCTRFETMEFTII